MDAQDNVIPFPRSPVATSGSGQQKELAGNLAERPISGDLAPSPELPALTAIGPASLGGSEVDFGGLDRVPPTLLEPRADRACFVVRVDLDLAQPPIWRRLRLASDLKLGALHDIVQIAMGWTDSHLHQFQMGPDEQDFRVLPFLTRFDLSEGETGIPEHDVRLDQVIADPGHLLFYEYDFGDGWRHTLKLEKVETWVDGDPVAVCLAGRRACPPEDVGGISGYEEVLAALDGRIEPDEAEWMAERLDWLPDDFDPSAFDAAEVNELLDQGVLPPLEPWHPEIGNLMAKAVAYGRLGIAGLVKEAIAGWVELDDQVVDKVTLRFRVLLRTVGSGLKLTAAGYLPPRIVDALYQELEMNSEWIGKGNREDMTFPVLTLRESATALGLVRKAKGQLTVTKLGQKLVDDPSGLLDHVRARLPLGRDYERDAGMLALLIAAAGKDWWETREDAIVMYASLGWRNSRGQLGTSLSHGARPTVHVLDQLTGRNSDPVSQATIARALLRRG